MGLPALSEDGVLSFPDPESIVDVYARLLQVGQFEAEYAGTSLVTGSFSMRRVCWLGEKLFFRRLRLANTKAARCGR